MRYAAILWPVLCWLAMPVCAQITYVWDLADTARTGQFTVYNPDVNDAEFGTPIAAGDLDGDGRDDLVISAMAGDGPANGRHNSGEVAICFDIMLAGGGLDLAAGRGDVVTLYGEASRDLFGIKTHVADIMGDGRADLLVGAFYADAPGRRDSGRLYLVSAELIAEARAAGRSLDLAQRPWPQGLSAVIGAEGNDRLGVWMTAADFDGDGHRDVVVGADRASGATGTAEAGRVYVLYGPLPSGVTIDPAAADHPLTVIYGIDAVDHAGSTVAAGDFDGDGYDDIAIGAAAFGTLRNAYHRAGGAGDGPGNQRENAGELYVVYGGPRRPPEIDLAGDPPAGLTVIYGADGGDDDSPDRLGEEIVLADIDGDGIQDLVIGAYRADGPGNTRPDAGEVYVVYGGPRRRGQRLDMAAPTEDMTVIYGARPQAITGDAVAAGDIHGDGYDDLFVGVPGDEGPLKRRLSGGFAVLAGGPDLPREIDLADPEVPVVWIAAPDAVDFSAYWGASGDIDGDGRIDAIPNGMAGDGPGNRRDNAGEAHIVSGASLSRYLPGAVSTATDEVEPAVPAKVVLRANYPNPFNSFTRIPFVLPSEAEYALDIYGVDGQLVRQLASGWGPGRYLAGWDARNDRGRHVASGVYWARLRVGSRLYRRPLVYLK